MELVKIHTDNDFSEASVPEGKILTFVARDESDKIVTRYKNSSGEFGTLSGGSTGGSPNNSVDVTLGEVNSNGAFVPLKFAGTDVIDNGVPEYVDSFYGWKGSIPAPKGGINLGDSYYKCVSVDKANNTWTGYQAVFTDGVYSFDTVVTDNLEFGTAYTPTVGNIFNQNATVKIANLWTGGSSYDEHTVALWDFEQGVTSVGAVQKDLELTNASTGNGGIDGTEALILSSSPSYARVTIPEFDRTKNYTVDFWCKVSPFSYQIMLYMNNPINGAFSPSTNDKLIAIYCTTSYICMHGGDYGGEITLYDMETSSLTDGNYHHVALVRTGDSVKFALDGRFSEEWLYDASPYLNDVPIHFGWDINNWGIHSGITFDNIRFSDFARWTSDFTPEV